MNFKSEISFQVENEAWDRALESNPASTAYQVSDYYQPYQLSYESKPVYISVTDPRGKIVGQLSAVIHTTDFWSEPNIISKLIGSKLDFGSTLSWFHGPIVHDQENSEEILSIILDSIDKIAIENKVNLVKGSSAPMMTNIDSKSFKKTGYTINPWITYITDLKREVDEIYNSLHNKTRYDIRKGEKKGLEFEVVSKKESFDLYLEVKYQEEKKIEKVRKLNKKFADNVWETSYKKGYEKMFLARFEGKPIAAIVSVLFNKNLVQMGVGNSPDRNLYGGPFLTWNSIKWAAENNFLTYDVGGSNPFPTSKKEEGINLFKSKWASKKIEYFMFTKVFNKTRSKLSTVVKQPKSITRKINKMFPKK